MDIDASGEAGGVIAAGRSTSEEWQLPKIDESKTDVHETSTVKRFTTVLDQLDTRIEKLRKDAIYLQDKRDFLLMSMDVVKNNQLLDALDEFEREEIDCYIKRVGSRLKTINLNVATVRDGGQDEALHQVNGLIDSLITTKDRILARHRCQTFLNGCLYPNQTDTFEQIDTQFANALKGCTLDDQKTIKKRLQALMVYLNKQTVTD